MTSIAPSPTPSIPLVDLALQHGVVAAEVDEGFRTVMARTGFVGGAEVSAFEERFATYCGARHCIGVANGTDALELILRARGVGPGDEVVLPTNSFVATAEAVARAGARPVLVDVDPEHLLIDPRAVAAAVGPRTRAVVAVHLFGQPAPVEAVRQAVGRSDVAIVEDAAQAHGARRRGRRAGTLGCAAGFSFYPGKNLGAYGDAGAVVTDDDDLALTVRTIGDHGSRVRYRHDMLGVNSRLDTLQAVVLAAKLRRLDTWNRLRAAAAERYRELLAAVPAVRVPATMSGNEHAWHLYVVRVPRRDAVLAALHAQGIGAAVHYPCPIHLQPAFRGLGHEAGHLPVAEAAAAEILSLPLYPGITPEQQERVVDVLRRALEAT